MGILNGYFGWNKARMHCFASMLVALIKVRTVNLIELACAFGGNAKQESRYKKDYKDYLGSSLYIRVSKLFLPDPMISSSDQENLKCKFGMAPPCQKQYQWGEKFLEQLSHDLRLNSPGMQGFSKRNLE